MPPRTPQVAWWIVKVLLRHLVVIYKCCPPIPIGESEACDVAAALDRISNTFSFRTLIPARRNIFLYESSPVCYQTMARNTVKTVAAIFLQHAKSDHILFYKREVTRLRAVSRLCDSRAEQGHRGAIHRRPGSGEGSVEAVGHRQINAEAQNTVISGYKKQMRGLETTITKAIKQYKSLNGGISNILAQALEVAKTQANRKQIKSLETTISKSVKLYRSLDGGISSLMAQAQ